MDHHSLDQVHPGVCLLLGHASFSGSISPIFRGETSLGFSEEEDVASSSSSSSSPSPGSYPSPPPPLHPQPGGQPPPPGGPPDGLTPVPWYW